MTAVIVGSIVGSIGLFHVNTIRRVYRAPWRIATFSAHATDATALYWQLHTVPTPDPYLPRFFCQHWNHKRDAANVFQNM